MINYLKPKTVLFIKLLVLIFIVITMGFVLYWAIKGGAICQNNPFQYGADVFSEKFDGNIQCNCIFYADNGISERFSFSNKGFDPILNFYNISGFNNYEIKEVK